MLKRTGRQMTAEELERVLRRYPGTPLQLAPDTRVARPVLDPTGYEIAAQMSVSVPVHLKDIWCPAARSHDHHCVPYTW
jgi:hypothetical protein